MSEADTVCKIQRAKQSNWTFAFTISMAIVFAGYITFKERQSTKANAIVAQNKLEIEQQREMINQLSDWFYESTDAAVIGVDYSGKIKLWNKGSERIFGYVAVNAVGKSINMIIPEKYRYGHDGAFSKAAQSSAFKAKFVNCDGITSQGNLISITITLRRHGNMFMATIYKNSEIKVMDLKESQNVPQ